MYEVCAGCGERSADPKVEVTDVAAIVCPACGHRHPFRRLPLFIITGASGTGKTSLAETVVRLDDRPDLVFLDSDMLLMKELTDPGWAEYRNFWLWVCFNISQSGSPVALFGSAGHEEFENAPRRAYFSKIHYLSLVAEPAVLRERLGDRPQWRQSSSPEFIDSHIGWNQSIIDGAARSDPPYTILDTSSDTIEQTGRKLFGWITGNLSDG